MPLKSPQTMFALLRITYPTTKIARILAHPFTLSLNVFFSFCHHPVYTINEDFEIIVEDHKTRAMDRAKALVRDCNVNELTLSNKQYESMSPTEQMTQLIACMEKRVNETIKEQQDEISFQREVRHKMAVKLVDYACNDTSLNTTESLRNTTFTYIAGTNRPKALKAKLKQQQESGQKSRGGGGPREMFLVQSLFQSEKNQLLYIENFLSPQECDALLLHSDPQTENTHFIPLDALQQDGLVEVAIEKIEVLIEKYLGKPISYQSDPLLVVSTLRPKGSGAKECMANIAAQGKPKKHKGDTDAAALRIFCETPLVGGSIHFHKVGVQINTVKAQGAALLAIFEDPDTHEREPAEEAFLEDYVECPVQAGDLISVYDHFTF